MYVYKCISCGELNYTNSDIKTPCHNCKEILVVLVSENKEHIDNPTKTKDTIT